MNNFKKGNRYSNDRPKFGGDRPKFGGDRPKRLGGKDFGHNAEMHQAVCADCGKTCEVPFRPNGKKPVYCKDCFAKNGGQVSSGGNDYQKSEYPKRDFARNDFAKKPYSAPSFEKPQNDDKKFDELKKQLEVMNTKFDKLVSLAETFISKSETKPTEEPAVKAEKVEKTEKATTKKVSPKKK